MTEDGARDAKLLVYNQECPTPNFNRVLVEKHVTNVLLGKVLSLSHTFVMTFLLFHRKGTIYLSN